MLTDAQMTALMLHVHATIEDHARYAANALAPSGRLSRPSYPPNGGYTEAEVAALDGLASTPDRVSGLRKLVAEAIASTVFSLFNVIDGTGDPLTSTDWLGFELVELDDDADVVPMLHDEFFETYWAWRERRPDPGWTLDMLDDA